jgi:hypothetical protein
VLDLEGRARYTPSQPKVLWDPRTSAPPVHDGTWETCIVPSPDYDVLWTVHQWLRSGQHPFVSTTVDSLMEAQKRCIDKISGVGIMSEPDWGILLKQCEALVRQYRDLTLIPSCNVRVVIFTVGSENKDGVMQPLLQGSLRKTVPYYFDVVGYMFMNPGEDGALVRSMLVHNQPNFIAKDNTGRLPGPIISNPDISQLMPYLNGNPGGNPA